MESDNVLTQEKTVTTTVINDSIESHPIKIENPVDGTVVPSEMLGIMDNVEDGFVKHDMPQPIFIIPQNEFDNQVPEVIAAETVVTTTPPRKRKQSFPTIKNSDINLDLESVQCIVTPDSTTSSQHEAVWTQTLQGETIQTPNLRRDEPSDAYPLIKVTPDSTIEVTPDMQIDPKSVIRAAAKRERDRLKKRELRANPSFREKEKKCARDRMKAKRKNPEYRELERQKDRIRRREARQRDEAYRNKERKRDKEHKRLQRSMTTNIYQVVSADHTKTLNPMSEGVSQGFYESYSIMDDNLIGEEVQIDGSSTMDPSDTVTLVNSVTLDPS